MAQALSANLVLRSTRKFLTQKWINNKEPPSPDMIFPARGNLSSLHLTKAGFEALDGGANDLAPSIKGRGVCGSAEYKALGAVFERADYAVFCQITFAEG